MANKLSHMNNINEVADLRDLLDPTTPGWQEAEDRLRELLTAKYPTEEVLVIKADDMDASIKSGFTEIITDENEKDQMLELNDNAFFMPRAKVEFNPAYKQLIPYVVATHKGKVFSMKRIQGDSRLVGNISLGIGGHINPVDEDSDNRIIAGLNRELIEEVQLGEDNYGVLHMMGYIYDPSNKVGQDHLGLVFTVELHNDHIKIKEEESLSGSLETKAFLEENYDKLENWSKIVYNSLIK